MAPLVTASQINLLIYHYLKESGFHHACFALRHESRLDDEPLSHEAVIEPGLLIEILQKGILYMKVEAHIDEDGNEKVCSQPFSVFGPEHVCDGVEAKADKETAIPARLTPTPEPEPKVKFVETSVQTQAERKSASRTSSVGPEEGRLSNGRRSVSEDRSSKVASSSKATLDVVHEDKAKETDLSASATDGKRKAEAKALKGEKRTKRDSTPKPNGRSAAASEVDEEEKASATDEAVVAPAKKIKRGSNSVKGAVPTTSTNGTSSKAGKGESSAYLPPLTGKAKGKQIDGSKIAKLKGHSAEVFVSAWNPAVPGLLASGAGDATVRIWDLGPSFGGNGDLGDMEPVTPTVCKHLPSTHAKDVSALSWNPDGTLLASGSYDGILRLWTPQGDLHLVMSMHQGPIFAVRWNRRGNFILTGSADGTAIVWDLNSGKVRQQFSSHSDSVLDIDWLTGSMDANPKHGAPSTTADNTLATCSADNSINILRLQENKPIKTLKGHTDEVNAIRFDPTGTLLASVSDDATARIWSLDAILGSNHLGIASTSNGSGENANGGAGGASALSKRSSLTPRPGRGGSVDQMDVDDGNSSVGDTSGGAMNELLGGSNPSNNATGTLGGTGVCRFVLTGHKKDIFAAAWAPHASGSSEPRLLATASFDNTARIWNAEDGTCLRVFSEHTDSVYSVCFSPDRRFLVTGGMDHRVFISSVATGDVALAHAAGGGVFDVQWHASKKRKEIEDGKAESTEGGSKVKEEEGEIKQVEGVNDTAMNSVGDGGDEDQSEEKTNEAGIGLDSLGSRQNYLALSQRDKALTVLDVSAL